MRYNAAITAQKTSIAAGAGVVGVVVEIVVDKLLPGWFPNGVITAAVTTIWVGVSNWWKNK